MCSHDDSLRLQIVLFDEIRESSSVRKLRALMLGLQKSDAGRKILEKIGCRGHENGDEEKLAAITKWLAY